MNAPYKTIRDVQEERADLFARVVRNQGLPSTRCNEARKLALAFVVEAFGDDAMGQIAECWLAAENVSVFASGDSAKETLEECAWGIMDHANELSQDWDARSEEAA